MPGIPKWCWYTYCLLDHFVFLFVPVFDDDDDDDNDDNEDDDDDNDNDDDDDDDDNDDDVVVVVAVIVVIINLSNMIICTRVEVTISHPLNTTTDSCRMVLFLSLSLPTVLLSYVNGKTKH